jgi:hypothetical protein
MHPYNIAKYGRSRKIVEVSMILGVSDCVTDWQASFKPPCDSWTQRTVIYRNRFSLVQPRGTHIIFQTPTLITKAFRFRNKFEPMLPFPLIDTSNLHSPIIHPVDRHERSPPSILPNVLHPIPRQLRRRCFMPFYLQTLIHGCRTA